MKPVRPLASAQGYGAVGGRAGALIERALHRWRTAHITFSSWPRISPGLCSAVWMLKYIMPSIRSLAWELVKVAEPFIGLSSGGFNGRLDRRRLADRRRPVEMRRDRRPGEAGAGRGDRQGHRGGGERCDKSVYAHERSFPDEPRRAQHIRGGHDEIASDGRGRIRQSAVATARAP